MGVGPASHTAVRFIPGLHGYFFGTGAEASSYLYPTGRPLRELMRAGGLGPLVHQLLVCSELSDFYEISFFWLGMIIPTKGCYSPNSLSASFAIIRYKLYFFNY